MPKYYRLLDLQTGGTMATGCNDRSLEELKNSLISYLSADHNEDDPDWKTIQTLSCEELCEMFEFDIEESETLFEENY